METITDSSAAGGSKSRGGISGEASGGSHKIQKVRPVE
jgi:hypothetical protein